MTAQRRAPAMEVNAAGSFGGPNPIAGFRRADLVDSVRSVAAELLRNRRHTTKSLLRSAGATMDIVRGRLVHQPGAIDHRFADSAWSGNFLYRVLRQLYLVAHAELDIRLAGTATGGTNVISGLRQFAGDVRHNGGLPTQVDTSSFEVGGNLSQDTTRLPAAPHGQLIDIHRDNTLARPGAVIVDGTPIDLGKTCCDTFVTAGTTDHITPWEACYRSAARLGGHVEFVLSNSGHIQSILSPPGRPNVTYFLNPNLPESARRWQAARPRSPAAGGRTGWSGSGRAPVNAVRHRGHLATAGMRRSTVAASPTIPSSSPGSPALPGRPTR